MTKYIEYQYGDEGYCKSGAIYNEKSEQTGKAVYRHDWEGNCMQETVYEKDGTKSEESIVTFMILMDNGLDEK